MDQQAARLAEQTTVLTAPLVHFSMAALAAAAEALTALAQRGAAVTAARAAAAVEAAVAGQPLAVQAVMAA